MIGVILIIVIIVLILIFKRTPKKWNYWIFVHGGENADKTFLKLIESKNWGFQSNSQIKNKISSLRGGDIVIFYTGGPSGKFFSGEARLSSAAHSPSRHSIGVEHTKMDSMVDFDNVDLWGNKRIYLTERKVREKLSFIKNK
ncbi:MAG: hypothetical protein WCG06_02475, partial [Candidatus Omnitrophota bacterium]